MANSQAVEPTRRDFLYIATGTFGGVGAALAAWPFISQMNPSASVLALASIEVDISTIQPGGIMTVMWRGKPVFIRRRTAKEIQEAESVPVSELIDPVARNANFPVDAEATDANRLTPHTSGGAKTEAPAANAAPANAPGQNTAASAPNAAQPAATPAPSQAQPAATSAPSAAQPAPANAPAPSAAPQPAPAQTNAPSASAAGPAPAANVPAAQQASPMAGEPPPAAEAAKSETAETAVSEKPEWLVVVGVCTHLGCIPLGNQGAYGGWLCPCHGSQYDTAGRVRRGPAPENLAVPPYAFLTDTRIKIG